MFSSRSFGIKHPGGRGGAGLGEREMAGITIGIDGENIE